jgi:hypothetical protein
VDRDGYYVVDVSELQEPGGYAVKASHVIPVSVRGVSSCSSSRSGLRRPPGSPCLHWASADTSNSKAESAADVMPRASCLFN